MRKMLIGLIAILSLTLALPAHAEDPGITTIGTATVYAVPDKAVFSVSITAVDADVAKACAKSEADGTTLVKAIKSAGIADTDIATDRMAIGIHYRQGTAVSRTEPDGFSARRSYLVTLHDLAQIEKVFSAMVQAGVDATPSVSLQCSNTRPYRDQARAMAVRAAQEKAVALAKELDQTVGKARTIVENAPGRSSPSALSNNAVISSDRPIPDTPESTPVGRIEIQASVTVTFELK